MAIVLLLRHGHSTGNAAGVLAGWSEGVGLTDRGRAQAEVVRARLTGVEVARTVSSPLQRCRETVALALPEHEVTTDERLGECHYGAWTGRTLGEAAKDPLWRVIQDDPASATFPPSEEFAAESLAEMAARVVGGVRALDAEVEAAEGTTAVWVAVSHGDPIKAVVAEAVGAGIAGLQRVRVDPGSVTAVHVSPHRMVLLASNTVEGALAPLVTVPREHGAGESTVGGGAG
ncbi:MSMEG_4193 family putative phosphomutase [Phycicoccus sp. CSK15P-2]|uniref:MSMEG_4193 family putative phosphomutase n=1 Tax=Phycicoccus sp. CSK15P-2 TaxID=2807627 RepID=UPI00194FD334|nr:MSMEG_4193 family putative phosphomutase [Phycicoccus sp. CSK15P-2]MBM6405831.1 MSMEG_4193 family putative phosphomutase [Phycicoccus sp. CSK15P-2]